MKIFSNYVNKHSIYIKIHKHTPESFIKDRFLHVLIIKLVLNTAENKNSITIVKPTMIY
ncbi:hypothetical protein [Methanosphaera stadtmanae]|uniref:hypothetical protein n=1 Tax=Methanosphaera stadtmanae TaxID=2317 RepID=UPI002665FEFA|nr:hypothetical protein [Methanosphaera stadtmanae]